MDNISHPLHSVVVTRQNALSLKLNDWFNATSGPSFFIASIWINFLLKLYNFRTSTKTNSKQFCSYSEINIAL